MINSIPSNELRNTLTELWKTRLELSTREIELSELSKDLLKLENEMRSSAKRGEIGSSDIRLKVEKQRETVGNCEIQINSFNAGLNQL
jgi:hypothetical protein